MRYSDVARLDNNPIITPESDPTIRKNIVGPSVIRSPSWDENALGDYYIFFASHNGERIHMGYSDDLTGTWQIYETGALNLGEAGEGFDHHIASPDAHVRESDESVLLYYHGAFAKYWEFSPENGRITQLASALSNTFDVAGIPSVLSRTPLGQWLKRLPIIDIETADQFTRLAKSEDGLNFESLWEPVGLFYFKMFEYNGDIYGLAKINRGDDQRKSAQRVYKSEGGLTDFKPGPTILEEGSRHSAINVKDDTAHIFYTRIGDAPERILYTTIDLSPPWTEWETSERESLLEPEYPWEGAHLPVVPSEAGAVTGSVNQLRDPAVFESDGSTYLFYTVAGESGIAVAELK